MTVIANPPLVPLDAGDPDDCRPRSTFAVLADPVREDGSYVPTSR